MAWAVEHNGEISRAAAKGGGRRTSTVSGAAALAFVVGLTAALWGAFRFVDWVTPGELIWPLSPDIDAVVVFVGVFLLILAVARMIATGPRVEDDARSRSRRLGAVTAGPILLFMLLAGLARIGVQVAGFAGLHPVPVPVTFAVVGVDDARPRGGSTRDFLRLRYGAAGRVFRDRVPKAVHDAARAGDTVMRPVETGRFGLQRAMVSVPLDIGDLHHQD